MTTLRKMSTSSSSHERQRCCCYRRPTTAVLVLLAATVAAASTTHSRISVEAFGVAPLSQRMSSRQQTSFASSTTLWAEAEGEPLNGAKAAVEPPVDLEEVFAPRNETTDEELESMIETTIITENYVPVSSLVSDNNIDNHTNSSSSSSSSSLPVEHAFAPPLTYKKFLTMQSKRVPVSIRYSAESGLKPFFLTVAQRIKENFPDVVLERVILPKVDVGESGFDSKGTFAGATFEVAVDGKTVVRTAPGRKVLQSSEMTVFVSMQELDVAIGRARRRRRPSTVYGDEDNLKDEKSRLEVLKNKAFEISTRNSQTDKQS